HIALAPFTIRDPGQDLEQGLAALAACAALAARLVVGELDEELGDIHHAGVFIHNNHSARTHHRAHFLQALVIDGKIDELAGDATARRSACLHRLELLLVGNAPADLVDDVAQGDAHRDLDQAGVVDLSDQGEDLGALAGGGSYAGEPLRAPGDEL